jgi:WD40 repeat protein
VALSAVGAFLAAGTPTGEVRLWRAADRTLLLAAQRHSGPVVGVALSRDGGLVASGSVDGTVRLWEAGSTPTPRQIQWIGSPTPCSRFSATQTLTSPILKT